MALTGCLFEPLQGIPLWRVGRTVPLAVLAAHLADGSDLAQRLPGGRFHLAGVGSLADVSCSRSVALSDAIGAAGKGTAAGWSTGGRGEPSCCDLLAAALFVSSLPA